MAKVNPNDKVRVKGMGFLHDRNTDDEFNGRVITETGMMTAEQVVAVGEAAKKFGNGNAAFTSRMCVEIQGIPFDNIEPLQEFLDKYGLYTGGTGDRVRPVVACKGKTCVFGLIPSVDVAKEIHDRFYTGYRNVELPHKFKIAVGGCPNNCVKPDLNDIGIIGQRKPAVSVEKCKSCKKCIVESGCLMNAARKNSYDKIEINREVCNLCGKCIKNCPFKCIDEEINGVKIVIGGRWGREGKKGKYLSGIYTLSDAMDIIEKIILVYKDNAFKKERFADMIDRLGCEAVEKAVLDSDSLDRKDEIINKEIPKKN